MANAKASHVKVVAHFLKERAHYLMLAVFGYRATRRIVRAFQRDRKSDVVGPIPEGETQTPAHVEFNLHQHPLDADLHFALGKKYRECGRLVAAYAEMRTACCLGLRSDALVRAMDEVEQELPPKEWRSHNQYFRQYTLSNELDRLRNDGPLRVLDVGGGDGSLAMFLPRAKFEYCLAEPVTNGISGVSLPFDRKTFDVVVSCHVLEHIPIGDRDVFLDNLVDKARNYVMILNPFEIPGTHVVERLQLVISLTDAEWAKEHLACTLPKVEDIKSYCRRRGLGCTVRPNGTLAVTMAMIFVDHFASKARCYTELKKLNAFFNEKYISILDSEIYPTAYLCTIATS